MDPIVLPLINTLIIVPFCLALFIIGRNLFAMRSLQQKLDIYKRNPKQATWFEKYFLGWKWWNTEITEQSIKMMGDRFLTGWYRLSGAFFMLFSVAGIIGLAILWVNYSL